MILPNGLGESTGYGLTLQSPLKVSGSVYWVSSVIGDDAYTGKSRLSPKATIFGAAGAFTVATTDGDIICVMDGHAETVAATKTISDSIIICAGGRSSGKPTVKITPNVAANGSMLSITADHCRIENIWFEESLQANTGDRVVVSTPFHFHMDGCYFESGAYDTGAALSVGDAINVLENTTFISTATATASRPESAIKAGEATDHLTLNGVTVDGGTVGYSDEYAVDLSDFTITAVWGTLSLLRGADIKSSDGTEILNISTATGAVMMG